MNIEERKKITGGLSKPSKTPGYAYNLPAIHCKTGSKLAQVPGTTCHGCYALKGRYRFPNVMDAMMRRLASIHRPDWARTMAADINARRSRWFRWHDSGDIQSVKHLLKIFQVCRMTPDVAHWLPTREAGLLSKIPQDRVPANLTIRLSATKVDGPAPKSWPLTSTVVTRVFQMTCPAPEIRGTAHEYWIDRRRRRLKQQATSNKRRGRVGPKASSNKPLDLWTPVG